ncbi:hypothetical protein Nocox_21835 [Nonomuraea coxensis DSM 45129]|uniref:Uncharacterized protein n=1 Tax=Nonomuraea coxensis DSM 45129 TaxID=1122611 RepID=A0ABX8U502_9ACTN|nr:hypothetical protein [Nonomuraea coxensis]QYC41971.1 hypothetical protein Nocox_21835 [Nonomuraea coxensis DSM 45129]
MTQPPAVGPRLIPGLLRAGAVLAASAPVLLKTSGVTAAELVLGICGGIEGAGPSLMTVTPWGNLLSWAELMLPAVLACLLLAAPRHSVALGTAAISAALMLRLPSETHHTDSAGHLPFAPHWAAVTWYAAALIALLLTARSPSSPARPEAVFWALAMAASAVTAGWASLRPASGAAGWVLGTKPAEVLWNHPWAWSCKAEVDGVLIVLVALAAAAGTVATHRARRHITLATAALLGLAALQRAIENLTHGTESALMITGIRWNLLVAAALVVTTLYAERLLRSPASRAPA